MNRRKLFQTAALGLLLSIPVRGEDWAQWRGPNRDGVWNETGILKSFPAEGLKIRWRVPVGPGWSSPVVVQARVYLTDMRLEKPGKPLWSRESELGLHRRRELDFGATHTRWLPRDQPCAS